MFVREHYGSAKIIHKTLEWSFTLKQAPSKYQLFVNQASICNFFSKDLKINVMLDMVRHAQQQLHTLVKITESQMCEIPQFLYKAKFNPIKHKLCSG